MASPLRFLTTRSGHVSVEVAGLPYHSLYDPQREARKIYAGEPIEKADVILHFGWGLGYSGDVLRERLKPSARVLIFEPDEHLFELFSDRPDSHNVLQDRRFKFVVGSQSCQFFNEWGLDACQETDEFLWLTWPAAYQIHGNLADKLRKNFNIRLRDRAANLLTYFNNGRLYFDNVLANLQYQNDPDAGHLSGQFKNVPVNERILSGRRACEEICRTHAEGRAAPAH